MIAAVQSTIFGSIMLMFTFVDMKIISQLMITNNFVAVDVFVVFLYIFILV